MGAYAHCGTLCARSGCAVVLTSTAASCKTSDHFAGAACLDRAAVSFSRLFSNFFALQEVKDGKGGQCKL